MLSKLSINNYALIDNSTVNFHEGFTVITGETGAGKSIMLDALSLLTGARADVKAMGDKERKMVVEAVFTNPDPSIEKICSENGIDWDPSELILRREISVSGKSRGFVNDTPVNLSVLSSVAANLIDIHSQHSNSLLNKPSQQLTIIDAYGGNTGLLEQYRKTFRKYVALRNQIKAIKENIAKGKENKDFITFRLEQLDKIKPKKGELAELEREAELLSDADRFKSDLTEAYSLISGQNSALKALQAASTLLNGIDFSLLNPDNEENLNERLDSIKIELRDIADTLDNYNDKIDADPARLDKIQRRIEVLYDVMKRFKVKDEEELVSLHHSLREELDSLEGGSTDVSKMESELKELAKELKENADKLSESRKQAAEKFAATIAEKIMPLGLPNIKFEVNIEKGKMSSEGQDQISFYCSFNKNHPMQPVSQIASGGEISRVMLGIKALMANRMNLPTIIFDEIDTGVSGEIAHKMGQMMKEMGQDIQVMAVTHLPQVAAHGNTHMKVYKADNEEKTISHIKELDKEERVLELGGMLSGTTINETALKNARMLLDNVLI